GPVCIGRPAPILGGARPGMSANTVCPNLWYTSPTLLGREEQKSVRVWRVCHRKIGWAQPYNHLPDRRDPQELGAFVAREGGSNDYQAPKALGCSCRCPASGACLTPADTSKPTAPTANPRRNDL